jgi:cathepsin B
MKFVILLTIVAVALARRVAVGPDMIARINAMQHDWVAAENHVTRMTPEAAKGLLGVDFETLKPLEKMAHFTPAQLSAIPDEFDSRTNWPHCETISQIRDQRHCGSCWAFGAVESMSDRVCIHTGEVVALSAEDMNSCSGSCGDCDGGYPSCAWQYWKNTGVVSEDCYPYTAGKNKSEIVTPPCLSTCNGNTSKSWKTDKHKAKSAYSASGEKNIMADIFTNGPVECAFQVYQDFMTYKSGVYHHTTGSYLGGHAVRMLGWGTESGVKYWLCANSWNTIWGDQGYFKIRRGNNECGIESTVWAGMPAKF